MVCFRNLKPATDKAIELFANKNALEDIVLAPFENYLAKFDEAYEQQLAIAPTVDSVNELETEEDEAEFIKAFRNLMRLKNMMGCFTDFSFERLPIDEFIAGQFKNLPPDVDVSEAFEGYWAEKKVAAQKKLSDEEHLDPVGLEYILADYLFTEKTPLSDDVIKIIAPEYKPKLKDRKSVASRVIERIRDFVATFIDGVD